MQVVVADVEREALAVVGTELRARGASALAVLTDVSRVEQIERLAEKTLDRFGAVHLLCNTAGVGLVGPTVWETTSTDWERMLGVNLLGVAHAVQAFVPRMLEGQAEGHIVNTACAIGLLSMPGTGAHAASEAGVITLSETLHHELALRQASVRVSVVCPAPLRRATESAMAADELAGQVFTAIREQRFYVFPELSVREELRERARCMVEGRNPWRSSSYESA
jgi:NAD(P)-dependent dehydrogenase (short-subunit alcohol dehydrogenase family)